MHEKSVSQACLWAHFQTVHKKKPINKNKLNHNAHEAHDMEKKMAYKCNIYYSVTGAVCYFIVTSSSTVDKITNCF